jgi:hypothetical protein
MMESYLDNERLYSLREAAMVLNVTPRWLRHLAGSGRITAVRPTGPTGMWYISHSTLTGMLTPVGYRR